MDESKPVAPEPERRSREETTEPKPLELADQEAANYARNGLEPTFVIFDESEGGEQR